MADRTESIILDFEVDVDDSIESIESLTKANKALREERKKLNIQNADDKKRIQEINATLDANTNKIKNNSSAIERQRQNIGNYRSALDGVHPALGKVGEGLEAGASGFKAMARSALAFIATPMGAILAALVTVFTLLKTALSQNNELMDKFENITNAVGTVVQVIVGRIGKLGEALIALVQGNFSEAINLTGQAFSGLAEEIGNAVAQSQLYLDLSRDLEDAQRALRIETARQENEIKRLVVAAKNQSLTLEQQEGLLRRALSLEEQLVEKRAENAQKDLVITAKRIALDRAISQSSEETFDQFINRLVSSSKLQDKQVDEIIGKIEALEQARGSSLAFQEKVENSLAVIQEKRNKILEEQEALLRANKRAQNSLNESIENPLTGAFSTQADELGKFMSFEERMLRESKDRKDKFAREDIERTQKGAELQIEAERTKAQIIANFAGGTSQLFREESIGYKVLASTQAVINTYLAATAALASGSKINPIFGIISAATAIATGLASVARINGVEFWTGGYTGVGGKHEPAGIVHRGEVVWNQEDVAKVGGPMAANALRPTAGYKSTRGYGYYDGGYVTRSVTQPINQNMEIMNFMKHMPRPVVEVVEIRKGIKTVDVKERLSKR